MTTTDRARARRIASDWRGDTDGTPLADFAATGRISAEALGEARAEPADYPAEYAADASRLELAVLVAFLENAA